MEIFIIYYHENITLIILCGREVEGAYFNFHEKYDDKDIYNL